MKESFLLYKSFYDPIKELSVEDKGLLFDAIFMYQIEGIEPTNTSRIYMPFMFFKNQFRLDNVKYEKIVERNKLNGAKGGRPKNPDETKKPTGLSGNPKNPSKPKKADNDNDNDNVKDNEKEKEDNKNIVFNFRKEFLNLGVEKQIIEDWLKVRKTKKATNTETAYNQIKKQIELSKLTANECIKKATENNWSGFKNDWIAKTNGNHEEKLVYTPPPGQIL